MNSGMLTLAARRTLRSPDVALAARRTLRSLDLALARCRAWPMSLLADVAPALRYSHRTGFPSAPTVRACTEPSAQRRERSWRPANAWRTNSNSTEPRAATSTLRIESSSTPLLSTAFMIAPPMSAPSTPTTIV